jgi:hypothetical protein
LGIESIVADLKKERSRLTKAIAALEGTDLRKTAAGSTAAPSSPTSAGKRRRRLTAKGRRRLSEMMKKRWAEAKKTQA